MGEYSLNALYTNLIKNDLTKYYIKPIDINTGRVTNRPMRSVAKKARLLLGDKLAACPCKKNTQQLKRRFDALCASNGSGGSLSLLCWKKDYIESNDRKIKIARPCFMDEER